MRVFVYEHLCSGAGAPVPSLRREGWAMLAAVLADLAALPDVHPITLLDPTLAPPAGVAVCREAAEFRRLAGAADFTLVIAPEFDDILYRLSRQVEEAGGCLFGPSSKAVRLCGDKLRLARHLIERGVPTPPCAEWPATDLALPLVCKPHHGAGSQATYLIRDETERRTAAAWAEAEGWRGPLLGQPYVMGRAASVAVLVGPGRRASLP